MQEIILQYDVTIARGLECPLRTYYPEGYYGCIDLTESKNNCCRWLCPHRADTKNGDEKEGSHDR